MVFIDSILLVLEEGHDESQSFEESIELDTQVEADQTSERFTHEEEWGFLEIDIVFLNYSVYQKVNFTVEMLG